MTSKVTVAAFLGAGAYGATSAVNAFVGPNQGAPQQQRQQQQVRHLRAKGTKTEESQSSSAALATGAFGIVALSAMTGRKTSQRILNTASRATPVATDTGADNEQRSMQRWLELLQAQESKILQSAVEPIEDALHGHDQDAYRDFVLHLWMEFRKQAGVAAAAAAKGEGGQQRQSATRALLPAFEEVVPASFGLVNNSRSSGQQGCLSGDPSTVASNWARFVGVSVLCLDFNRDVRLAHKGKLPGKREWTAEQHFEAIKAQWLNEEPTVAAELRPFLEPLQFIQVLTRYEEKTISGFVAYHPGMAASSPSGDKQVSGKPELHAVVQGSYLGMQDTLTNANIWLTPFSNVLEKLGLSSNSGKPSNDQLTEHRGYAKIAQLLYPQIEEAIRTVDLQVEKKAECIVVSGHSLGSAVGAGLLRLLETAGRFSKLEAFLFAQPRSFKHLDDGCSMKDSVLDIRNVNDPVVMASEIYRGLGTQVAFDGAAFVGAVKPEAFSYQRFS